MKKKFSTSWKGSKLPKKQRKYLANAPQHIRLKIARVNLSKDLRKKLSTRSITVRKNDTVKIMRGKYAGKTGKVKQVNVKKLRVYLEELQIKKTDGSKVDIPIRMSNLQITEIGSEDKTRIKVREKK